jgi:hypothetical protein
MYRKVRKKYGNGQKYSTVFYLYAQMIEISMSHKKAQKAQRKLATDFTDLHRFFIEPQKTQSSQRIFSS